MAYVYAILVDGTVRYIGKGGGGRALAHIKFVQSIARRRAAGETVRTSHFYNKLTKAWLAGAEITELIIAFDLNDEAAFEIERIEIAKHKSGKLWNIWPGGEGASDGHRHSLFTKKKISETNIKTWSDSKLRSEHSARAKVHWLKPEYRNRCTVRTEEWKQQIKARAKKRWADPIFRAKMKAIHNDPATKERRHQRLLKSWVTRRAAVK